MAFPKRHSGFSDKKPFGDKKSVSWGDVRKEVTSALFPGGVPKGGWTKEQQDAWDNRKMPGGAYSKAPKGSKRDKDANFRKELDAIDKQPLSFAERMKAARNRK